MPLSNLSFATLSRTEHIVARKIAVRRRFCFTTGKSGKFVITDPAAVRNTDQAAGLRREARAHQKRDRVLLTERRVVRLVIVIGIPIEKEIVIGVLGA